MMMMLIPVVLMMVMDVECLKTVVLTMHDLYHKCCVSHAVTPTTVSVDDDDGGAAAADGNGCTDDDGGGS